MFGSMRRVGEVTLKEDWAVGDGYTIQREIGQGSYGRVAEAVDNKNNQ